MALRTGASAPSARPPLGRGRELGRIREALAGTGGPVAVVLEGEAGIGKTALWRVAAAEAAAGGRRVLTARPGESETALSYAALGDLLAAVADELGDDIPGLQRRALDVALLRATPDEGALDPRAVGTGTLAALRATARSSGVLLAIDDVQWLDAASAAALRFALRRLGDEPVALLATERVTRDSVPADVGLGKERLHRMAIGPLAEDALQEMIDRELDQPLPRPTLARLVRASGGNPYYALELARAALRHGAGAGRARDVALPKGLSAVLRDRLEALPPATREAVGVVAAMGAPRLAQVIEAVDADALDAAFAAGALHEDGETIRFDHPLLAAAAYGALTPARRRAAHKRLAGIAVDPEERASHLAATTRPDPETAAAIEAGAEAAAARGAPATAAELLEASAQVEPDLERAARRRLLAVRHHMAAGDGRRAAALASALANELPPGPLRSRALVAVSQQEGPLDEMLDASRRAVEEAGDDLEALLEAMVAEANILSIERRDKEALELLTRARERCGPETDRALRVKVLGAYGETAQWDGDPRAIDLIREAAQLEGEDLIPDAYWGPGMVLGRALMWADDLESARAILEQRHRRALELGDDESRAGLSLHLAELECRAGRFEHARRHAEEGLAIQEGSYAELAQGSLVYARALVAAHQGELELARSLASRGLAQCEAQGDEIFAVLNRCTLGFVELTAGDNAAAFEYLGPALDESGAPQIADPGMPHVVFLPDAIEALIGLGRLAEADHLLAAWDAAGRRFDRPRVFATAERCRALAAAARGELEIALAAAEAALEQHARLPLPFERARTLIVLGAIRRRTKHKAAARAALEEALASLEAMGAAAWAERARAELARIGGRARSAGLTPTEERVAELVAEGRTNREVAEALFVSVRTVESNLTRIFAKLGLRSRTELASRRGP